MSDVKPHLGLRVAYHGKPFSGFQLQPHSRSVQQKIEEALSTYFRKPIRVLGASRTDAGVHAFDQWVSVPNQFELYENLDAHKKTLFLSSLNALLAPFVSCWQVLKLDPKFHPKRDMASKEYHYTIQQGAAADPLLCDRAWWIRTKFDEKKMTKELKELRGTHDFRNFSNRSRDGRVVEDAHRTIFKVALEKTKHPHIENLHLYKFKFRGSGFLYRMVRNMVGVLVDIGRGKDISIKDVLNSEKRPSKIVAAPAEGLCLVQSEVSRSLYEVVAPVIQTKNKRIFSRLRVFALICFCAFFQSSTLQELYAFDGSASFVMSQRFFEDDRLAHVNGFSEWGAFQFDFTFGVYEFDIGLEPIIGLSYIQNSASLYALDDNGDYILDDKGERIESSVDNLSYEFYTASLGLRYKPWSPDFFIFIPYAEVQQTFRYGRVKKVTYALDQQKLNTGVDWGVELGGGIIISFMYDDRLRSNLKSEWDLKDFGLITSTRYLSSGYFRQGLGLIDSTGGWDFGLGLFLDW